MTEAHAKKRKSFGQECPVARALDVVGDRWTMLIVRELLGGPARFHDLESGLPGIAKNLLASRLRRLEDDDVVRRVSSGHVVLYALTEQGARVRPALEQLGFWGAKLEPVGPIEHERSVRAIAMALQAILARGGAVLPASPLALELDVEGESLEIVLGPEPTVTARPATKPRGLLRASRRTLEAYLRGSGLPLEEIAHVSGDVEAGRAFFGALGVPSSRWPLSDP